MKFDYFSLFTILRSLFVYIINFFCLVNARHCNTDKILILLLYRKASQKGDNGSADWQTLKCVALIMEGLVLFATAAMNISLAFFIAAVWVPVTLIIGPSQKR